jgi:hypothetical protein
MLELQQKRRAAFGAPLLIRMSFQQRIPWQGALQQSLPPLRLLLSSSTRNRPFGKCFPLNGNCPRNRLSQLVAQATGVSPLSEVNMRAVPGFRSRWG